MTLFETALLVVLIYICVFGIVNRICKCIEQAAMAKVLGAATVNMSPEQLREITSQTINKKK